MVAGLWLTMAVTCVRAWTVSRDIAPKVIEPAATETKELNCPHFNDCSGCSMQRAFDTGPIAMRARSRLEPLLGKRMEFFVGQPEKWRTQARLAVGSGDKWRPGVELGLYRRGTHQVVGIPECAVHDAAVNAGARALEAACRDAGVTGVEEDKGDLRYAQLSVEKSSQRVVLTLVWNGENAKEAAPTLPRLVKALWPDKGSEHDLWHSIWVNYRGPGGTNAIFNLDENTWVRQRGDFFAVDRLFDEDEDSRLVDTDLRLSFSPLVFRQSNHDAFARLVKSLARWVPDESTVCELYAGVGAVGLSLRPRLAELRCSDGNPNALRAFEAAVEDQDRRIQDPCLPALADASFLPLEAHEAIVYDAPGADVLIVDPPRKGLDPQVIELLTGDSSICKDLSRIIYISCGFEAFERDLLALTKPAAGMMRPKWALAHAEGHVLFPGSDHIETLAIFERPKPASRKKKPSPPQSDDGGPAPDRRRRRRGSNSAHDGSPVTRRLRKKGGGSSAPSNSGGGQQRQQRTPRRRGPAK